MGDSGAQRVVQGSGRQRHRHDVATVVLHYVVLPRQQDHLHVAEQQQGQAVQQQQQEWVVETVQQVQVVQQK